MLGDESSLSRMPVRWKPPAGSGPSETSAVTSRLCGVPPASAITFDSCMAKQDECAAAISSSGFVPSRPLSLSKRRRAEYGWSRSTPLGVVRVQGDDIGGVILAVPALNWIIVNHSWHYAFGALGVVVPMIVWGAQRMWTKDHPRALGRNKFPITVSIGEPAPCLLDDHARHCVVGEGDPELQDDRTADPFRHCAFSEAPRNGARGEGDAPVDLQLPGALVPRRFHRDERHPRVDREHHGIDVASDVERVLA